jgi:hypothetical protein
MGIEQDAAEDLALSDDAAELVAGGKKTKKTLHKATPKSSPVEYVNIPSSTTQAAPDDSGTTAWGDDCVDPSV